MENLKEVPIFIASSVKEFEHQREEISVFLDMLNDAHERDGVRLRWYRPETMSRALVRGGSQLPYNDKIRECRFFILLIGKDLGQHTVDEFKLAWELYQNHDRPVIIPYFLNVRATMKVLEFQQDLRKKLEIDGQSAEMYVDTYDSLDQILQYLHIELIRHGAFRGNAEPSGKEETARKGQAAARDLIREQREKIAELEERKKQNVTPQLIAELTDAYEELTKLVQEYKMEPDVLDDYLIFLWSQHLYDRGIELGHWLEHFYQLDNADDEVWAFLKHRIAICYQESNRYEQGEKYYREALNIRRRLALQNSDKWDFHVAETCNNLAALLYTTNRMEEAEGYYREALEIRRRLAEGNPAAYEPDVATTCFNLGLFEGKQGNFDAARRYFREAQTLYEKFPHCAQDAQDCRDQLEWLDLFCRA